MKALLLLLTLLSAPAIAAEPKVVMVLYFDNNTTDREYDVLQKGLADMLISDLAGVEGLKVVEREKLQALIDELKLQGTSYFDSGTVGRLGKGTGARYAITGSITAVTPKLRLDVRLVDLQTGEVEKTEQVTGEREKFFELEQALVARFLARLGLKAPSEAHAGETDLDGALAYSKALDLTDKGELKAASEQLSKAVQGAPDFTLAKERYAEILKRLREAGKKRQEVLSAEEQELLQGIAASFARGLKPPLKPYELESYFCHRGINRSYLGWKLTRLLPQPASPELPQVINAATRAEAVGLMKQYYANWEQAVNDSLAMQEHIKPPIQAVECPMTLHKLGNKDFALLKHSLRVPFYFSVDVSPIEVAVDLVEFTFAGKVHIEGGPGDSAEGTTWRFAPTLFAIDPSYGKKMLALLDAAQRQRDFQGNTYPGLEYLDTRLAAARADVFIATREPQKAIAVLQALLEKYPKLKRYKAFENAVEDLIGVSAEALAAQKAIKTCDAAALDATIGPEVRRIADAQGPRGLAQVLKQLGKCEGEPAKAVLRKAQLAAAAEAVLFGDCTLLKALEAMGPTPYATACDGE
ncbi:MAG: hypothetical protein HY901_16350 [Deltaproteobacteria bacterium]|nr:hypothetical protein [Deltaproteobacteria bacterium]